MAENNNKKRMACALLASGYSVRGVAQKTGVSESTIARWKKEPVFQAKIFEIQRQFLEQAVGQMVALLTHSIQTLGRQLSSDDAKVAGAAADRLLRHFLPYREAGQVELRLAALEAGKILEKPTMAGQSAKGKKGARNRERKRKSDDETAS